jgi:hypothetical protein
LRIERQQAVRAIGRFRRLHVDEAESQIRGERSPIRVM